MWLPYVERKPGRAPAPFPRLHERPVRDSKLAAPAEGKAEGKTERDGCMGRKKLGEYQACMLGAPDSDLNE